MAAIVTTLVTATAATAGVSAPPGAAVNAGQGTSFTASYSPTGALACFAMSGGGEGVSVTASRPEGYCADQPFTVSISISTSGAAAGGTYDIVVQDTVDGGSDTFRLTVRPAPTTTAAPPPTTTPPTTAAPTTLAPVTTPPETATTLPPEPTTTLPPTTTTAPVDAGAFASVASLVAEGPPEEGVFLPLIGARFRECLPLTKACTDPSSAVMLLPARDVELAWASAAASTTPLPQVTVRSTLPLQPVGEPFTDQPAAVNYLLTIVDLADQGAPKSLPRGLNPDGELVAASADQEPVEVQATGVDIPESTRTFIASEPFGRPSRLRTTTVAEATPAIPLFLGTQQRVIYGIKSDPAWGLNSEIIPLLGNGNVPYLVRTNDGAAGLVVPIPPGLSLSERTASDAGTAAADEDDDGDSSPVLPIVLGVVVLAALVAGAIALVRWRRRRMLDRERAATRDRAESILQAQPKRFRR